MTTTTATSFWIDLNGYDVVKPGAVGYLVSKAHTLKGWETYELRDEPARTNSSRQPKLHGWCGSYNDVSTVAHGIAKVVKVNKAETRAYVTILADDAPEAEALKQETGYPDL